LLSNVGYQLNVVDTIAQNTLELNAYRQAYNQWRNLQSELKLLQKTAEKQASDIDYVQFQYQQLVEARLTEHEQEELEQEQETLSHAEEIKSQLLKANQLLDDENMSLSLLKESVLALSHIKSYIPLGENWHERLQSSLIELKDVTAEMSSYEERVEFNPERLSQVESRLSELFTLQKKYKVGSVAELIELRDGYEKQLQRIDSFEDDLKALNAKLELAFAELEKLSQKLTDSRRRACGPIESYLIEQLVKLGMPNIQFKVDINNLDEYSENGNDEVQFLFSANKNRLPQPVTQIASGGEVSRLMLSIKSLVAHKADLPTIIFDEIDTGVSGEIAHRMGEIMRTMSAEMQVITITHLPQIAGKGAQHYSVFKDDTGLQTQTHIRRLNEEERLVELAQMLSGKNVTDAALQNAQELLRS